MFRHKPFFIVGLSVFLNADKSCIQAIIKIMRNILFSFISVFLCLFSSSLSSQPYTKGLEISYECLPGSNSCDYRIYHHRYIDCSYARHLNMIWLPPSVPQLTFNPSTCTAPSLISGWTLYSLTDVTPVCPGSITSCSNSVLPDVDGTYEAVYYADYSFCNVNCSIYQIADRSTGWGFLGSISLYQPYYGGETQIDLSLVACNNSPVFTSPGSIEICWRRPNYFDYGAYDPDGDSLSYQIVACKQNIGQSISYVSGYSAQQPLGSTWQVTIDSVTGLLHFKPLILSRYLSGALCIEVKEYRNGVCIGSINRDFHVYVDDCQFNQIPQLDSIKVVDGGVEISPSKIECCVNDTLVVQVHASDPNLLQLVKLETSEKIPGLLANSQTANPLISSLFFKPPSLGTFHIPLKIKDDFCLFHYLYVEYLEVKVVSACITAQITHAPCGQAVGAIDVSFTGGIPPYQYLWNTGDTTEDISGLLPGPYGITVTDSLGIKRSKDFFVNATNISLGMTLNQPTCSNTLGSITTAVSGGIPPYRYLWSTGDTTANLANLPANGYSLTVMDSTACPKHRAFILAPADSCFNIIEGIVFDDVNGNCIHDAGEMLMPNMMVSISPGYSVLTGQNAGFRFKVGTGNFDLEVPPKAWQSFNCPSSGRYSFSYTNVGNVQQHMNFAMHVDSVQELGIYMSNIRVRPGDTLSQFLTLRNDGSIPMSGTVSWEHDSIFQWLDAWPSPTAYNPTTRLAIWNFSNLPAYQTLNYEIRIATDSLTALGHWFSNTASVIPILGDSFPTNNIATFQDSTRGSFDPNDKHVSPAGMGSQGLIEQHENTLNYTVRFQNTGTDTAIFVRIRDTIDVDKLDILSFQRQMSSHPYQLRIEEDSILIFAFDHINLPDSNTNLAASQGFVMFGLELKDSLAIGSQIVNSAAIYFDFNAPVITNSVLNTIFTYPEIDLGMDTAICQGQPLYALLSHASLPPYAFRWSDGNIDLNNNLGISQTMVQDSGIYQVTVTDALGITAETEMRIDALPLPDASFSYVDNQDCTATFMNTSTVNNNWYWDFGDGDTASGSSTLFHCYAARGTYSVKLIVENDCGKDTMQQDIFVGWVGLEDDLLAQSIKILPHPVQGVSYLHFANPERKLFRLRLLDLQGREVRSYAPHRGEVFEIAAGDLAAGMYIYELNGSAIYVGKMLIK